MYTTCNNYLHKYILFYALIDLYPVKKKNKPPKPSIYEASIIKSGTFRIFVNLLIKVAHMQITRHGTTSLFDLIFRRFRKLNIEIRQLINLFFLIARALKLNWHLLIKCLVSRRDQTMQLVI